MMYLDGVPEGALRSDGLVEGCYIHGLFTSDAYRARFLSVFRGGDGFGTERLHYENSVDRTLDELALYMESCLDIEKIASIAGLDGIMKNP
jgi:adenosylcobyric acid synthase